MPLILKVMKKMSVHKIVFASTGAVYDAAFETGRLREDARLLPSSPYGLSKLLAEEFMLAKAWNWSICARALRFFNVIGASKSSLVDTSSENLLPKVIEALKSGETPEIYGYDYPTKDGTAVRDYIDVRDIARAHLEIISTMNSPGFNAYNVGTGSGLSVKGIFDQIMNSLGKEFEFKLEPRRLGDPSSLVADPNKLISETKWRPQIGLQESIDSTLKGIWGN